VALADLLLLVQRVLLRVALVELFWALRVLAGRDPLAIYNWVAVPVALVIETPQM
jgi:hypothetical protein